MSEAWDDLKSRIWAVFEPPLRRCADFLSKLLEGKGKA